MTVGVTPVGDFAPLYYAQSKGYFTKVGLSVTIDPKGSSEVPPLLSNSYQAVSMSWPTFIQAIAQGVGLTGVFPGITGEPKTQTGIYAMPSSGITTAKQLAGKSIAINQPKSSAELNARVSLTDAGLDPTKNTFPIYPITAEGDALVAGKVQAAYLVPPFSTEAAAQGAKLVLDAYGSSLKGTPVAGFVMSDTFVKQNPNSVKAFQKALSEAAAALTKSPSLYRSFIQTYTTLTPDQAQQVPAYTFATSIDDSKLQKLSDLLYKYTFSTQKITASKYILQPGN